MKRISRRPRSCSPRRDEGATLLGTLVALAILAIAVAAAFPFFIALLDAMDDSMRRTGEIAAVRGLDAAARSAIARVRPPFWSRYAAEAIDGGYAFPYFDGVEGDRLRIFTEDGSILLEAEGFRWRSEGVGDCEVYRLDGTDGVTRGAGLLFYVHGESVRVEAPFGTYPFSAGAMP